MAPDDLRFYLQRPIAFYRVFATVAGGAGAGLFLSQLFYWSDKGADPDGWIYKTQAEWEGETGLIRSEQERARKVLRDKGLLHEVKRGTPARLYYRLDFDALARMLDSASKDARCPQTRMPDAAVKPAASGIHLHTETTTENTQENELHPIDRLARSVRPTGLGRR